MFGGFGLAVNPNTLVVVARRPGDQVLLFDLDSGAHIRTFGKWGTREGELQCFEGVRFTPDGGHILIACTNAQCLSSGLFTLAGEFVRRIGVGVLSRARC